MVRKAERGREGGRGEGRGERGGKDRRERMRRGERG